MSHSIYLRRIFRPRQLKKTVNKVGKKIAELKECGMKIDSVAFSGNSGAGIAYPLSFKTGIPLICVRKGERSHGSKVESVNAEIESYIIVDDCIASGRTVNHILDDIEFWVSEKIKCVGIILYDDDCENIRWANPGNIPIFRIPTRGEK